MAKFRKAPAQDPAHNQTQGTSARQVHDPDMGGNAKRNHVDNQTNNEAPMRKKSKTQQVTVEEDPDGDSETPEEQLGELIYSPCHD
jgi:hypothetical protein